ncbi:MAG: AAA family ATPase [Edaphobacter sp.]
MYKEFFHLSRNPFDLTPDPTCFVPTKWHNEALVALHYGIRRHKGFVVLTGEVGTGKTLLLRCLIGMLKESPDVSYAYLFNGRLSPNEFLQYILSDFGLPTSGKNKSDLLFDLGQFLIARGSRKMTTVLIVDEAHLLSSDLLEEVRLLSNLETDDDKLLQIVLVGQPELNEKLDSVGLRQLKQRIAVRTQLGSLDAEETNRYIHQRLQIAGGSSDSNPLFPEQTLAAVYRHSRGLPRLINTICENALIAAYARRLPSVSPGIIEDVAKEFRLDVVCSAEAEGARSSDQLDLRRVTSLLNYLYAALQRPVAGDSDLGAELAVEASKHEPYI